MSPNVKLAIVTGASTSIGKSVAFTLLKAAAWRWRG